MSLAHTLNAFGLDDGMAADPGQSGLGQFESLFSLLSGSSTAPQTPSQAQALYLQEPGTATPISVDDIHQGQIGDCYLLSSIGEMALNDPGAISNMIHSNPNGTETVTLYTGPSGQMPGIATVSFKPVSVTVSNVFPTVSVDNGSAQDVVGNQKEIWPQVLEKAVATLDGGYGVIDAGGNPTTAMEQLTGHRASDLSVGGVSQSVLQAFVAAGDLITMDTANKANLPYNLIAGHAYMLEKVTMSGGTAMVQLGNPWGTDQPALIPFSQLSKGISEVDVGKLA